MPPPSAALTRWFAWPCGSVITPGLKVHLDAPLRSNKQPAAESQGSNAEVVVHARASSKMAFAQVPTAQRVHFRFAGGVGAASAGAAAASAAAIAMADGGQGHGCVYGCF